MGVDEITVLTAPQDSRSAAREQWDDGSNTLAIAPGVVVTYERNVSTNRFLADQRHSRSSRCPARNWAAVGAARTV